MLKGKTFMVRTAAAGFVTIAAAAQVSTSYQAAVDAYRFAIASAEVGTAPRGIDAAFEAVVPLREALMRPRDGGNSVLESLTDAEFARLDGELPGVLINREEVVFVRPDVDYFTRLAVARGDAADRAFFAALKTTYPESVWPVYVEQQTDSSGCTRFGSMSLVETYRMWSEFRRQHPGRHETAAVTETNAVLEQLTESTCACGSTAAVELELEQFIRRVSISPVRTLIAQRLLALRAGRTDIRTNCVSG